ncbi:NUDIX domain-containing protein [Streptosporangium sp. NPDC050855]|uniref:NUDIX domain-containing protein n=1 Tax=Streptosporangium sp. NPDC050855 TaxID=3366194 RepID=UPI0037B7DB79
MIRDYTHPDVLGKGVQEGWADPCTDPAQIDWAARQSVAAIAFAVVGGRPVNPFAPTGIERGRGELGHWGEGQAADAVVTLSFAGTRRLLLIERDDEHGWAVPGGFLEAGEEPLSAAIRELAEESGLILPSARWRVLAARYVPDPRATDEAWMVTTPATVDLGQMAQLPLVRGADDARTAAWVRADTYTALLVDLGRCQGQLFRAHRALLTELLGGSR